MGGGRGSKMWLRNIWMVPKYSEWIISEDITMKEVPSGYFTIKNTYTGQLLTYDETKGTILTGRQF